MYSFKSSLGLLICSILLFTACNTDKKIELDYEEIKKEVLHDSSTTLDLSDTADIFDGPNFDPEQDSLSALIDTLESIYEKDSTIIAEEHINDTVIFDKYVYMDTTISNPKDSFTSDIKKITADEIRALRYNLKQLHDADSILAATHVEKRGQIDSRVWCKISKTDQRLYLYIDGEVVDTFKVSTGSTRHETPLFDMQPRGPIFQKYTSKKYPGGNYNGLGNMPYVVFIQNGYGFHGTTRGNIPRLGKKASHGCIRLHPDNAKILNELIRKAGIENSWVTVVE